MILIFRINRERPSPVTAEIRELGARWWASTGRRRLGSPLMAVDLPGRKGGVVVSLNGTGQVNVLGFDTETGERLWEVKGYGCPNRWMAPGGKP